MNRYRLLLFALLLVLLMSCSKMSITGSRVESAATTDLREAAVSAMAMFFPETKSSAYSIENVFPCICESTGDTVAFACNFTDDMGFAIISAFRDNNPLIVSQSGSYPDVLSDNHELQQSIIELFDQEAASLLIVPGGDIPIDMPYEEYTIDTTCVQKGPYCQVQWHQGEPFNWFAVNPLEKYAGCTPVAIAQAMSVFDFPDSLSLTYPGANLPKTALSWTDMKLENESDPSCPYCIQKASLLREIGWLCDASYGFGGTGADPSAECFSALGYSANITDYYNLYSLKSSLDQEYPCTLSGTPVDSNYGHTWLVDGYKEMRITCNRVIHSGPNGRFTDTSLFYYYNYTYLHFNYGWGGDSIYILAEEHQHYLDLTNPLLNRYIDYYPVQMFSNEFNRIGIQVVNIHPFN